MAGAMEGDRLRVLFVSRTRYRLPLDASLRRKFDALRRLMRVRVLASAPAGTPTRDETFALSPPLRPRRLDGLLYYTTLPLRVAREARRFRPQAIVAESPYAALAALAGRALAWRRTPVVLEVHGDWRTAMRLYGSPLRRLLAPLADRAALAALRRADAVRALSPATTRLLLDFGVQPAGAFPAYVDCSTFLETPPRPLPDRPQALFVGVLERYKNVDGLVEAWRRAGPRVPGARLRIVGEGPLRRLVDQLVRELPEQTAWQPHLPPEGVARALDEASVLVLPSRSEGLPRVAIEALCRGRPVLATRVGGVPDLIDDEVNGFLVDPDDVDGLAETLVRVLATPEALEPLVEECRCSAEAWIQTPDEFADRVAGVVSRLRRREPMPPTAAPARPAVGRR